MAYTAPPLLAGDVFELARRVSLALDRELAAIERPEDRMACLARHWREVTSLGWAATLVPEENGGVGGTLADLAALADGAGRAAFALPLASCFAVVPSLLRAAGARSQAALMALAEGRMHIVPLLPPPPPRAETPRLKDGRLQGSLGGIEAPPDPTHLLVACDDALLLVPTDAAGVTLTPFQRIDGRLTFDITLSLPVNDAMMLARGPAVPTAVARARDLGALLTCVEAASAMAAVVEETIAYLLARTQFGTTLSTFQALRHRVAEMYLATMNLRALITPMLREDAEPPWQDIAFAKLRLGEAGRFVAHAAIQLHGGMGQTEEMPAIRLARRILMAEFEYGDRTWHATRLLAARETEPAHA
jgi:alkylation response protein AidB-like acyl-CoA dehydrogenase